MSEEKLKDINIELLEFPLNVRTRPGMYIGAVDNASKLLSEIIDNAVDEVYDGNNKLIYTKSVEGFYIVADLGRGIPVKTAVVMEKQGEGENVKYIQKKLNITQAELSISSLHSGSKFNKTSSLVGQNGVGSACLHSDTLIRVRSIDKEIWFNLPIRDLCNRMQSGERFITNCKCGNEIRQTEISKCWITKYVNEYLNLKFSTDSSEIVEIKCTPDHKFMKSNGDFIEAKDIDENTELAEFNLNFSLKDVLECNVDYIGHAVYRIYDIENNKSYVGSFQDSLLSRFVYSDWFGQSHKTKIETCKYHPLYIDIRNKGIEKFRVELLYCIQESVTSYNDFKYLNEDLRTNLRIYELNFINKFNSVKCGYNLAESGNFEGYGKAGSMANKVYGTNRWNSDYQKDRAFDKIIKSVSRIYSYLKDNNIYVNELNWNNQLRYNGEASYRTVIRYFDKLVKSKVLSELDRSNFNESRFNYKPAEILKLNGITSKKDLANYTRCANKLYSILKLYGKITKSNIIKFFNNNPRSYNHFINKFLDRKDLLIKANYISESDIDLGDF